MNLWNILTIMYLECIIVVQKSFNEEKQNEQL